MKTAILISGHMRSFDKCLPNLAWLVFRHFPDADFYVSTVNDQDASSAYLLAKKYPTAKIEISAVDSQPEIELPADCPSEWTQGRPYTHEPFAISVSPQAVVAQLWQLNECWKLFQATRQTDYATVVRCRPDLWFHSFVAPDKMTIGHIARVPNWGRFGGINDRFAILGAEAASHYFTTFQKIEKLWGEGCPIHPESLVAASLEDGGCPVIPFGPCDFSTLRKSGEMRPPEMTVQDVLHAAQRGN